MKKTQYEVEDSRGNIHRISPKKINNFSGRPKGGSCNIFKLELCSIDDTKTTDLCIKKAREHILEDLNPKKSVSHQMAVFKKLKEANIPTYSEIRKNDEKEILITPFIGDEKKILCFSANNTSHAKDIVINDKIIQDNEIGNIDSFSDKVNNMMDKLQYYGIKVFDDSFFFSYDCNGCILDIFIGDFHDIEYPEDYKTVSDKDKMSIRMHNKNKLEFAYQMLQDDRVITKGIYDTLYNNLRGL